MELSAELAKVLELQRQANARGERVRAAEQIFAENPKLRASVRAAVDIVYHEYLMDLEYCERADLPEPQQATYLSRFPDIQQELLKQFELQRHMEEFGTRSDEHDSERTASPIGSRFEVRECLSDGAFSAVYRAWDRQLKREVAMKFAKAAAFSNPRFLERFRREAEAVAQLAHPGVVQVFETGVDDERPFIVSQLMTGGTLADRFEQRNFSVEQAADWVRQISDAADYAHQLGVVHRDIKPANILFSGTGNPLLADFGLALRVDTEHVLTEQGDLLGTPAYMSPEQARGEEATKLSDVYSIGVVLYEALAGRPPYLGRAHSVIRQVANGSAAPLRTVDPTIPHDLSIICSKAMEQQASARYESARDLADDLKRFLKHEPIHAKPPSLFGRLQRFFRREPALSTTMLIAAVSVCLVAGFGYLGVSRQRDLFRQERDRANSELRDSLLSQAESHLRAKTEDWHANALQLLSRASELSHKDSDLTKARDLMVEVLASGSPRLEFERELQLDDTPLSLASNQERELIAFGYQDGTIEIRNGVALDLIWEVRDAGDAPIDQLGFTRDGKSLIALSDTRLRKWHLPKSLSKEDAIQSELIDAASVEKFAVGPEGRLAVALPSKIQVFVSSDTASTELELEIANQGQQLLALEFCPDGNILGSFDNATIRKWSVTSGQSMLEFRHNHEVPHIRPIGDRVYFSDVLSSRVQAFGKHEFRIHTPVLRTQVSGLVWTGEELLGVGASGGLMLVDTARFPLQLSAETKLSHPVVAAVPNASGVLCVLTDGRVQQIAVRRSSLVVEAKYLRQALTADAKGNIWSNATRFSPELSRETSFFLPNVSAMDVSQQPCFALQNQVTLLNQGSPIVRELPGQEAIQDLSIAPSGRNVLAVTTERAYLLDTLDLRVDAEFQLPPGELRAACLIKGNALVHTSQGVYLRTLDDQLEVAGDGWSRWLNAEEARVPIALSGLNLLTCNAQRELIWYDVSRQEMTARSKPLSSDPQCVRLVDNGQRAAVLTEDGQLLLLDRTGEVQSAFNVPQDSRQITFDPQGEFVVLWGSELAMLFELASERVVGLFTDGFQIQEAQFEADGQALWLDNQRYQRAELTQSRDSEKNLEKYDILIPGRPWFHQFTCAVSPNGRWHVAAGHDRHVYVTDQDSLRALQVLGQGLDLADIWCCEFSPDSKWLVLGTERAGHGEVVLIGTENWTVERRIKFSTRLISSVRFHPSWPVLAVSSYDGSVALISLQGETLTQLLPAGIRVMDVKFSADGRQLAAACTVDGVRLWKMPDTLEGLGVGEFPVQHLDDPGEVVWTVEFLPNQLHLAWGTESGKVRFFDRNQEKIAVTLQTSIDKLRQIVFTPDERFMAVSRFYEPGQIWDVKALRSVLESYGLDW